MPRRQCKSADCGRMVSRPEVMQVEPVEPISNDKSASVYE
jgi:hypothetical protein